MSADLEGKEANKLKVKISWESPALSAFVPVAQLPGAAPLGRDHPVIEAGSTSQQSSINALKYHNQEFWGRRKLVCEQWEGNEILKGGEKGRSHHVQGMGQEQAQQHHQAWP